EIERALGQRPERLVLSGKRRGPGVFELLGPPQIGEPVGVRPRCRAVAADRGVHVGPGAVGVEHTGHRGVPPPPLMSLPARAGVSSPSVRNSLENSMADWSKTWTFYEGDWHEGNVQLWGVRTHAIWLGSSVFDGARAFEGTTPDADLHCARVN